VTSKPFDLHDQFEIIGCRDPTAGWGHGVRGATEPTAKRKSLSVVPDAGRARVNIKKLPLISHKGATNQI